jgi:hypothetical protein
MGSEALVDPPMRLQQKSRMGPGEDSPDCVYCGAGLHEARPLLRDVLTGAHHDNTGGFTFGRVDVDCPTCGKPNEVHFHICDRTLGVDAVALSRWTQADAAYMKRHGHKGPTPPDAAQGSPSTRTGLDE